VKIGGDERLPIIAEQGIVQVEEESFNH